MLTHGKEKTRTQIEIHHALLSLCRVPPNAVGTTPFQLGPMTFSSMSWLAAPSAVSFFSSSPHFWLELTFDLPDVHATEGLGW